MFLLTLFHKKGPRYLRECLPYNTELNLGISKFSFLKLYLQDLVLKMLQIKSGTSLYLTLYASVTMSYNLLLRGLGSLERSNNFIYVSECHIISYHTEEGNHLKTHSLHKAKL